MADPSNWPKWGYDNNDGDVCCADQAAAAKAGHGTSPFGWLVWGASTQGERTMLCRSSVRSCRHCSGVLWAGAACGLKHCATNAVGRFNGSLEEMMASFFDKQ